MNINDLKQILASTASTKALSNHYIYNGKRPLDVLQMPLDTVADMEALPTKYKFRGRVVKVLNTDTTNIPVDYWYDDIEKIWVPIPSVTDGKLELQTNVETSSIELVYDGQVLGSGASLTEILQEWQNDQFVTGGSIVKEEDKVYLDLYYDANHNIDEDSDNIPDNKVRIDVTELAGAGTDAEAITGITINGSAVTVTDRIADIVLDYQEQIDALKEKLDKLQVSSAVTTDVTSSITISYTYIDKETGEPVVTDNEQEAIDNAKDGKYSTTETKTETTVVTNTYIQNIGITDLDDFLG